jgi:hypothetical protein
VNGINVIFAPGFVWLYEHIRPLPFLLAAGIMSGLLLYAFTNPALRNAGVGAAGKDESTLATLEREDEGGV